MSPPGRMDRPSSVANQAARIVELAGASPEAIRELRVADLPGHGA